MISIVIFTRDDSEWLGRCLGSLSHAPPEEPVEVIVFDNASTDDTLDRVRSWRGPRGEQAAILRATRDTSFSEGNSLGLEAAVGDLTLFLNPDTEPTGPTLDACAQVLRTRGAVGLVGPRLVYPNGDLQDNGWALPTPVQLLRERLVGAPRVVAPTGSITSVGWLMGCFLMGRTADLRAVGGFDRRFWFHGTDLEICARVRDDGWDVVRLEDHALVHRGHRDWTPARVRAARRATARWLWTRAAR